MSHDELAAELRTQANRVLEAHPELQHRWDAGGELTFPALSESGFDVVLQPDRQGIIVSTSVGFHEHCEGPLPPAVTAALGLARDLLSPDMRVREQRAGGRPYRWHLERRVAGGWAPESQTGLLLWNYLGRRTERIYENAHLPARLGLRRSV